MQQTPTLRKLAFITLTTALLSVPATLFGALPAQDPPVIDTQPPVIDTTDIADKVYTATRPIVVPRFNDTDIPAASIATLIDVNDAVAGDSVTFSFEPTGEVGPLLPGRYRLTWTATDLGFNQTTATQVLDVLPGIELAPDQTVGEGGTARVTAHLSGPAPAYPFTVPFTVSGSAGGGDYSLSDAVFEFSAGATSASISIEIIDDGLGDDGETIVIALDTLNLPADKVFAGLKTDHSITIEETNHAPLAQLSATQNGNQTRAVIAAGGLVTVSAAARDADGDVPGFDWSASDNALVPLNGTTGSSFIFDPQGLTPGFYTVRLTLSDSAGAATTHDMLLALLAETPTLPDGIDRDDDGAADVDEGLIDSDNDGIPDYLDANANPALMQGFEPAIFNPDVIRRATLVNDSITLGWEFAPDSAVPASNLILYPLMISTEPGLQLNLGPTAFAANKAYARLSTAQAEALRNAALDAGLVSSDGQVVDLEITHLNRAGASARIIIPQTAGIPPAQSGAPRLMIFSSAETWVDFSDDGDQNRIRTTAQKDGDYCPGLGDVENDYPRSTIATGDRCLLLTLEDGGPNDYDGRRNGAIRFMGGVFITTASVPDAAEDDGGTFTGDTSADSESLNKLDLGTGDGGGALGWAALLGLLLAGRRRSRRQ